MMIEKDENGWYIIQPITELATDLLDRLYKAYEEWNYEHTKNVKVVRYTPGDNSELDRLLRSEVNKE